MNPFALCFCAAAIAELFDSRLRSLNLPFPLHIHDFNPGWRSAGMPSLASPARPRTVRSGFSREILLRPRRYLIGRWNWKSALVSAVIRSAMFFRAVLGASPPAALSAALVEFFLAFALA